MSLVNYLIVLSILRIPFTPVLPGMAAALEVSVQYLVTGEDTVRPADDPPRFVPVAPPSSASAARTSLTIPVLACACPDPCPLMQAVPPRRTAGSTVVLERDLVGPYAQAPLIAVAVTLGCPVPEWRAGTRLVVAWGVRPTRWEALALIHAADRCQWGHVSQVGDNLLFADDAEDDVRVIPAGGWTILGVAVAVVAPL